MLTLKETSSLARYIGWSEARTRKAVRDGLFHASARTERGDKLFTDEDAKKAKAKSQEIDSARTKEVA